MASAFTHLSPPPLTIFERLMALTTWMVFLPLWFLSPVPLAVEQAVGGAHLWPVLREQVRFRALPPLRPGARFRRILTLTLRLSDHGVISNFSLLHHLSFFLAATLLLPPKCFSFLSSVPAPGSSHVKPLQNGIPLFPLIHCAAFHVLPLSPAFCTFVGRCGAIFPLLITIPLKYSLRLS